MRNLTSTKVIVILVPDLLNANDFDLVECIIQPRKQYIDQHSRSLEAFTLSISLDKAVVMTQPVPRKKEIFILTAIVSDSFVYFGSTLNYHCSLDDEIALLLYSCEIWVVYRRHVNLFGRFHQRCLRNILGINRITYTSNFAQSQLCFRGRSHP